MTRGGTRYDGSPSRFDHGSIGRPAVDSPHDRGARDQTNRDCSSSWSIIGRRRQGTEEPHDRGSIELRSRRDRAAIELRSRRDRAAIARFPLQNQSYLSRRRSTELQDHDRRTIMARSRRDRGPIMVRSWQKFEAV